MLSRSAELVLLIIHRYFITIRISVHVYLRGLFCFHNSFKNPLFEILRWRLRKRYLSEVLDSSSTGNSGEIKQRSKSIKPLDRLNDCFLKYLQLTLIQKSRKEILFQYSRIALKSRVFQKKNDGHIEENLSKADVVTVE